MGLKDDIAGQVKELLAQGDYTIHESDSIPGPGDNRLTFGNTAVEFHASALFLDMRGSTQVLNAHHSYTVAKIHKAYLYAATTIIAEQGGQIRSYNGDSILAFFPKNTKDTIESAIKAAMRVRYLLKDTLAPEFAQYHPVDFGIGVDHGKILCVKAGRARNENHNDLIWLGNAVNRSTVLSDNAKGPGHIWISNMCRANLLDSVKLANGSDMWTQSAISYNGQQETAWSTTYSWQVA